VSFAAIVARDLAPRRLERNKLIKREAVSDPEIFFLGGPHDSLCLRGNSQWKSADRSELPRQNAMI
jgi:hypothetical protein